MAAPRWLTGDWERGRGLGENNLEGFGSSAKSLNFIHEANGKTREREDQTRLVYLKEFSGRNMEET